MSDRYLKATNTMFVSAVNMAMLHIFAFGFFKSAVAATYSASFNRRQLDDNSAIKTLLQTNFEKNFNDSCLKYNFVHNHFKNMENPSNRFVVFVYNEKGLRNGGLGDRLGGLISASMIALRLNRTLLIQSENGFDSLFRPYSNNPNHFVETVDAKWTYTNWTSWTPYNESLANNDETEYDLWDCINCIAKNNAKCGLDYGDVNQNIVKLRANRAYLCKWVGHKDIIANAQVSEQGVNAGDDLLEAAGCLLRLAMWPTQKLWDFVDKMIIEELEKLKSVDPKNPITLEEFESIHKIGLHYRCGDRSYIHPGSYDRFCEHDAAGTDPHEESPYMRFGTPVDLGMCARRIMHNYTHDVLHKALEHNSQQGHRHLRQAEAKSHLLSQSASTAFHGFDERSRESTTTSRELQALLQQQPIRTSLSTDLARGTYDNFSVSNDRRLTLDNNPIFRQGIRAVVYIASDNPGSAKQMSHVLGWPYTVISPNGCHVELDPSPDCTMKTTAYWLMLSFSEEIVTQSEYDGPISAFSRYAAIYGLRGNSTLRNSLNCDQVTDRMKMAYQQQGNWFCN